MDCEVPELAGREDEDDPLGTLYDRYLTELIGVLRHGGDGGGEHGAGSSVIVDSPDVAPPPPPQGLLSTTSTTTATSSTTTSGDQVMELPGTGSAVVGAGEAEMASWLCQVFEEGAAASDRPGQPAGAAATCRSGGSSSDSGDLITLNDRGAAEAAGKRPVKEECRGCSRSKSGAGKRSCTGRAAEQTDKASTLDGVIQHIKYLQHQLQVMSSNYAMQQGAVAAGGGMVQPYLLPGGDVVFFGFRPPPPPPPPPPPTTMTLQLHHSHGHQLVPAVMLACPHQLVGSDRTGGRFRQDDPVSSTFFLPAAGDPSQK